MFEYILNLLNNSQPYSPCLIVTPYNEGRVVENSSGSLTDKLKVRC